MQTDLKKFIQKNSPDGGFLQSKEWRQFQESVGRKTFNITGDNFYALIIEHELPIVGKYLYIPRGPIISNQEAVVSEQIRELVKLAGENKAGWIRVEPLSEDVLEIIKNWEYKTVKAPHDMQPKETFVLDITKSEEELLAEMKSKTRYNIKLAEKKGVSLRIIGSYECLDKDVDEFLRLTKIMAERQGIKVHSEEYYRKMFEKISEGILKLYIAEYKGKAIAANLVIFYGETCTYLHGASDDKYRKLMASYLLQWQAIKDAKAVGCKKYDFGGVRVRGSEQEAGSNKNSWKGITRFKLGFSPKTQPVEFPGSYDIVVNPIKYWTYRIIQSMKNFLG